MADRMLHPWAEAVNKDGAGVIHIDIRDGYAIANFGNVYDRVLDNVVQIAWALQPPIGGKFLQSGVAGLPFVDRKSADASAALWRLYESGLLDNEYKDIQPLFLGALPQSSVQFTKPIDSIADLSGHKIAVADKMQADIVTALGGAPQSLELTDVYEALQRGNVDGAVFGPAAFAPFRIHEVTSYHVDVPFGTSTGMVFMAKKTWESLPQAAKDVLAKHMGKGASRGFGEYWDGIDGFGRSLVTGKDGHTVVTPTKEQMEALLAKAGPIVDAWPKSVPDGDKILAEFNKLLAEEQAAK
jgi:TRAP-type C4-dicarboxylate transport system substrate-binding protein